LTKLRMLAVLSALLARSTCHGTRFAFLNIFTAEDACGGSSISLFLR
jgi:hypothetical protein